MIDLRQILSALLIAGAELVLVAVVCTAVYKLTVLAVLRPSLMRGSTPSGWPDVARVNARNLVLVLALVLGAGVFAYNGQLVLREKDVYQHTMALLRSITVDTWIAMGIAVGKLALAIVAAVVITRVLRRLLRIVARVINQWDQLQDNNKSIAALLGGLERAVANVGWMLVAVFTCSLVAAPENVTNWLLLALRIYVVFAIGLVVVRSTAVIVDTFDGLSRRYAQKRGWLRHYDHLRPLVTTLKTCLEYALWIGLASLIVVQLEPLKHVAVWGPRLIQAIAIFLGSRIVIELGRLELGHRMLPGEGLEDTERRRRATMVPLVRSVFTYAVYFGGAVLMLGALGFNPMPFLAGAGILGLVVGFGAQALINDVVSGFFILFENMYLVGETIEVGDAKGIVEAIEFRTTRIRDDHGRLHIIRNGDMKPIVNYSRDYTVAVVDVNVGYDADLRAVFAALREAADGLRAESSEVLQDTEIEGVVAFGHSTMTVRTLTRVKAGRNDTVAAALRLAIKEIFDRQAGSVPRRTLIPKVVEETKLRRITRRSS